MSVVRLHVRLVSTFGLDRSGWIGLEPATYKDLPALLVGLLNGLGAPVFHFQNQQPAPGMHHHKIRVQVPGADRHVVPKQIVVVELLLKPFSQPAFAAGHA